ncbi:MAG: hypothetical protein AVDCRST_MAG58-768 [uncultured Rubrobacteraceae bacterium]|uniref:Uncharacterized protein n=1 Tax=uncultured Rubrobacteraceae bacterium TaxID=349277 RepID=A0A6J4QP13_9ACTN|nr:MAG: hypothetical protein AVDCRST_MAG58-768 [uncultured Rubrobacteraceae bacterium]
MLIFFPVTETKVIQLLSPEHRGLILRRVSVVLGKAVYQS